MRHLLVLVACIAAIMGVFATAGCVAPEEPADTEPIEEPIPPAYPAANQTNVTEPIPPGYPAATRTTP
jgi:hypothetical protein